MGKPKRKLSAKEKAEKRRRRKEYMTIFVNGKQKRVKRPETIDGMDMDEFIRRNADPIWLHQNEMWEYMVDEEESSNPKPLAETGGRMRTQAINLGEKLSNFSDHWSPKIIAQMNDYHFKLVKFQGDFVWHDHKDTDEVFIVLGGEMTIHLRDRDVMVKKGEMFVIPKGVEHMTSAKTECCAMLIETAGTVNTGAAGGDQTASSDVWI